MTAVTARPIRSGRVLGRHRSGSDATLRFAVRADATLCAAAGLLVAFTADPLSRLSGLSPTSEWIAGAALVFYGAVLYALAGAPGIRRIGIAVVLGNAAFGAATVVVVVAGVLPLTGTGVVMTLATAAVTLAFAELQYLGVRRLA